TAGKPRGASRRPIRPPRFRSSDSRPTRWPRTRRGPARSAATASTPSRWSCRGCSERSRPFWRDDRSPERTVRAELWVEARLENLARIRAFVAEACRSAGALAETCSALTLAVDEACTNIIEHAYAGTAGGSIEIAVETGPEELRVTLLDRGRPFDPSAL